MLVEFIAEEDHTPKKGGHRVTFNVNHVSSVSDTAPPVLETSDGRKFNLIDDSYNGARNKLQRAARGKGKHD